MREILFIIYQLLFIRLSVYKLIPQVASEVFDQTEKIKYYYS
jgi:hypothetical protein